MDPPWTCGVRQWLGEVPCWLGTDDGHLLLAFSRRDEIVVDATDVQTGETIETRSLPADTRATDTTRRDDGALVGTTYDHSGRSAIARLK